MIIKILDGEVIAAGTNHELAVLELVPIPGEAFRMATAANRFSGRMRAANGLFTGLKVETAPTSAFGNSSFGMESDALTVPMTGKAIGVATSIQPFIRLSATGTAGSGDSVADLVLQTGFPLLGLIVVSAAAGMPWDVGDDLTRADFDRVVTA